MPLFHWAPTERRKQIIRHGLRPSMRGTTAADQSWRAPHVCFAESPSWAWALSGYFSPHIKRWDLWQTYYGDLVEPKVIKTYDKQHIVHEIRTSHRVYKRALWLAGERAA